MQILPIKRILERYVHRNETLICIVPIKAKQYKPFLNKVFCPGYSREI